MNAIVPKATRTKMAKLLELMVGTDFPGERESASLALRRMIDAHNLSWGDVIDPPAVEKQLPELGTWRQTCARCLACPGALWPWEVGFLRDLPQFRRLSTKQRYVLKEIAGRVLGEGGQ